MSKNTLHLRSEIIGSDLDAIREMVTKVSVFSREEIDVAVELATDRLTHGEKSGYHFLLADIGNMLVGYTCFGRIPLTENRFDLYWIVVDMKHQKRGVAGELMTHTESAITTLGGKAIYAETSSRDVYAPAHAFYANHAFAQLARLPNFYADGDDQLIFGKTL